ncbi:MAG: hypothetical protein NT106_04135 [Candidatus Sumerlaeota bacterium]|nr:hypothetical protein [Candidatus Sumerlaeota bacterium]
MGRKQIYIGDYVRLKEEYVNQWKCEHPERLKCLRETIFIVIETCRCYNWRFGIGGGGMLLALKPFIGPLVDGDMVIGRGEESVELVDPATVDALLRGSTEEELDTLADS